jgi:hypothetical protein
MGDIIRGIDAEKQFIDEIILLCLGTALTRSYKLRKIRGVQDTKEKTTSKLYSFSGHQELPIAHFSSEKA